MNTSAICWGVHDIDVGETGENVDLTRKKGIIVSNIRMGFGHYRISMAIASAAHSMGYMPYWMDLNSLPADDLHKSYWCAE